MKNSLKISLFILLLCGIFSGFLNLGNRLVHEQTSNSRWNAYKALPEDSLDILFMGNSHSFCSIDPRVVDNLLETNSFVLGISAETAIVTYYELIEALKTQSPDYVVFETYILDHTPERNQSYYLDFIWNIPFSLRHNSFIKTITDGESDVIQALPAIYYHDEFWKNPKKFFLNILNGNNNVENMYSLSKGYMPRETLTSELFEYPTFQQLTFSKPYPQNLKYFSKIIELCKQNNITPIFIEAPILNDNWMTDKNTRILDRDLINSLLKNDLFKIESNYTNSIYFTDEEHLSVLGAIKYSIDFSTFFSTNFNTPLNQKNKNLYIEFIPENIQVKKNNNNSITIEIINKSEENKYKLYLLNHNNIPTLLKISESQPLTIEQVSNISALDIRILNPLLDESRRIVIPIK